MTFAKFIPKFILILFKWDSFLNFQIIINVYKYNWLLYIDLYLTNLNSFIGFHSFLVDFLRFSIYKSMSSANRVLLLSFQSCFYFIFALLSGLDSQIQC